MGWPGSDLDAEDSQLDLLSAALWAAPADQRANLEQLAGWLQATVPEKTTLAWEGGLFRGPRRVAELTVRLQDREFRLTAEGGSVAAWEGHRVRGITLRSDQLAVSDWLKDLTRQLVRTAREDRGAEEALHRLLG